MRVQSAIGRSDPTRIVGAFLYNLGAVAVTFPESAGSQKPSSGMFQPNELITARVTYLFRCQVPLASLLMCSSGWSLLFGDAWLDPHVLGMVARTASAPPKRAEDLPQWSEDWKRTQAFRDRNQRRVETFKGHAEDFKEVEWPFMLDALLALPGARYMVLSAEAQLPMQGANYYPRIDKDGKDMQRLWDLQAKRQSSSAALPDLRAGLGGVKSSVDGVVSSVGSAVQSVQGQVDALRNKANGYVADVQNQAAGYGGDLQNQANGYIQDIQQQASGFVGQLQQTVGSAIGQVANPIASAVGGAVGSAKGALNEAKTTAAGYAKDVKDTASGYAKDIKNTAAGYAGDVKSTAQGYATDLNQSAQGLGSEAQKAASSAARSIQRTGNEAAADLKREGNQLAKDIQATGREGVREIKQAAGLPSRGGASKPAASPTSGAISADEF